MATVIKVAQGNTWRVYERETLDNIRGLFGDNGAVSLDAQEGGAPDAVQTFAEARSKAEERIREAYAEGLRRGMEAGKAKFATEVGEAAQAWRDAAGKMAQVREEFLNSLESQVIMLVRTVAERVIQREARTNEEMITNTVRSALDNLVERERLVVRVNPADFAVLRNHKSALMKEIDGIASMEIVTDEEVGRGGCVVDSETRHVDARLDAQLEQILNALSE